MAYQLIKDGDKTKAFNTNTGEITDTFTATYPVGTISYTPEQQEQYREKQELQKQQDYKDKCKQRSQEINAVLGRWTFVNCNTDFSGLPHGTLARLFFLASFLDFAHGNKLMDGKNPIRRSDLAGLLYISEPAVSKFLKQASRFIWISKEDEVLISSQVFAKGKLLSPPAMKVYQRGIRTLYRKVAQDKDGGRTQKLNHIGLLFMMLPYINTEYNVLCRNPDEKDLKSIEPIRLKEFCEMMKIDVSNISKLKKIYKNLTFDVNGEQERFVAFVNDGLDTDESVIVINPAVLYSGNNHTQVEAYALYFK